MSFDDLSNLLENLSLDTNKKSKVITIQRYFRGFICRLKRLPLIMNKLKAHLLKSNLIFAKENEDGRINSCIDEDVIIRLLVEKFETRIIKPKIRMWYDILAYDNYYGWIPINIKTTTTKTSDNTGNLAMCVYAYTNEELDLQKESSYNNGKMSKILFDKIKNGEFNKKPKKDYYFLVLDKENNENIIINSVKGLVTLTPNINNLPFQVIWCKNRRFKYDSIKNKIRLFIYCLQNPEPSWKETFLNNMRTINLE